MTRQPFQQADERAMVAPLERRGGTMLLRAVAAAIFVSMLPLTPAIGAELVDSEFQVSYQYGGTEQRLSDTRVPLLPGNVCYTWWMQLAEGPAPQTAEERLILPAPPADWGSLASDPDDGVEISADGTIATSDFVPEPDGDGWFSKGWCAAEGDPLGLHRIEVSIDGTLLQSFEFEVVAPEDYPWPVLREPDPHERSVQGSW